MNSRFPFFSILRRHDESRDLEEKIINVERALRGRNLCAKNVIVSSNDYENSRNGESRNTEIPFHRSHLNVSHGYKLSYSAFNGVFYNFFFQKFASYYFFL